MKKIFYLMFIALFISCNSKFYHHDPQKILGTHLSTLRIQDATTIENKMYYIPAEIYNKRKAIIYVYNADKYCIDYYFTNLLSYNKKIEFAKGTSHTKIIKKLGKPAYVRYGIYDTNKYLPDDYAFLYTYLFLHHDPDFIGISNEILEIKFDDDGRLISYLIGRQAP